MARSSDVENGGANGNVTERPGSHGEPRDIFEGIPDELLERYLSGEDTNSERATVESLAKQKPDLCQALIDARSALSDSIQSAAENERAPRPISIVPESVLPAPSPEPDPVATWQRVAKELGEYRAAQQQVWAGLDDLTIARYVAGECSEFERHRVERAFKDHPELLRAINDIRHALDLPVPVVTGPGDLPDARPWSFDRKAFWALAASVLVIVSMGAGGAAIGWAAFRTMEQEVGRGFREQQRVLDNLVAKVDSQLASAERKYVDTIKITEAVDQKIEQTLAKATQRFEQSTQELQQKEKEGDERLLASLSERIVESKTDANRQIATISDSMSKLSTLQSAFSHQMETVGQLMAELKTSPSFTKEIHAYLRPLSSPGQGTSLPPILDLTEIWEDGHQVVDITKPNLACPTAEVTPTYTPGASMAPTATPFANRDRLRTRAFGAILNTQNARIQRNYLVPSGDVGEFGPTEGSYGDAPSLQATSQVVVEEKRESAQRHDKVQPPDVVVKDEDEKAETIKSKRIQPFTDRSRVYLVYSPLEAVRFQIYPHGKLHLLTFRLSQKESETERSVKIEFVEYRKLTPPTLDNSNCTKGLPHSIQIADDEEVHVFLLGVFGEKRPDLDRFEGQIQAAIGEANANSLRDALRIAETIVRREGGDPLTIELHQATSADSYRLDARGDAQESVPMPILMTEKYRDDEKEPAVEDAAEIPGYFVVEPNVATGGQPTLRGMRWIKERGFHTVLNLLPDSEADPAEASMVRELGLEYISLPSTGTTINRETVEQFNQIVDDPEHRPLFIHDSTGSRTGAMWYLHRVTVDKVPDERARRESARIGLKDSDSDLWLAIQRYLAEQEPERGGYRSGN